MANSVLRMRSYTSETKEIYWSAQDLPPQKMNTSHASVLWLLFCELGEALAELTAWKLIGINNFSLKSIHVMSM